jgi:protein-disulfide isomerase
MRIGLLALLLMGGCVSLSAAPAGVVEGNPASPVKVLIYEDLQCSDCANLSVLLDQKILPRYGSKVAFIHRDFPLGKHDWARPAAIAARWVYEQDRDLGIIFRRELMAEQNSVTSQNLKAWLVEFAARNKLDRKGILDSLNDKRLAALVDQEGWRAAFRAHRRYTSEDSPSSKRSSMKTSPVPSMRLSRNNCADRVLIF